jgi:putative Mn2+ efflux pump MntP
MGNVTIILIAIGLAMDAFAVSIASGVTLKGLKTTGALKIAASFGIFQAIMPLIGWFAGKSFSSFIVGVDHWIAFCLLSMVGVKMIYESTKMDSIEKRFDPLKPSVLLVLSLATSIDALAVGVTFSFLNISIITPVIVIGLITFFLAFIGGMFGNRLGSFLEGKIEIFGGLILIGIGLKILLEHLF